MTQNQILQADMLDIIFEHRNKSYGAYALRREYNHHMGIALGTALGLVLLLTFFLSRNENGNENPGPELPPKTSVTVIIPPDQPDQPDPEPVRKDPQVAQANNSQVVIVPDDQATDIPTIDDLAKKVISNHNVDGPLPEDPNQRAAEADTTNSDGQTKDPVQPFVKKEIKPAYPGGPDAFLRDLQRLVGIPDLEPGEKKTVLVRFVVDTDGSISAIEILQSAGEGLDKSVLKALKKMKKWAPGIQNDLVVKSSFTQAVTFIGYEE